MRRRVLSLLLALAMVLSLLPTVAFAAATAYDVWVGGEQFTSDRLTIQCGTGTATLDVTTNPYTLTLNNATVVAKSTVTRITDCISTQNGLRVCFMGDNVFDAAANGIWIREGDLTIFGDGKLTVKGSNAVYSYGPGDIAVSESVSLDLRTSTYGLYAGGGDVVLNTAGDVTISAGRYNTCIRASSGVTISSSGDVSMTGGTGIVAKRESVEISGNGDVTINATAENNNSSLFYGINAGKDFILSGSGNIDVIGVAYGVVVHGETGALRLEGTSQRIALSAGKEYPAILNDDTEESPVVGSKLAHYSVTGSPASGSVTFTWKEVADDIWIGSTRITDANMRDVFGDGKVSYDPQTKTLRFTSGMLFSGSIWGAMMDVTMANSDDTLTIVAPETGRVLKFSSDEAGIAMYRGNLALQGNITIDAGYYGIRAEDGDVTVCGNSKVSITTKDKGIEASGDVFLSGDGEVTITSPRTCVDAAGAVTVSGTGSVTLNSTYDMGINAKAGVNITGSGELTITAGDDGIDSEGDVVVSGSGKVLIDAETFGIYVYQSNLVFSGRGEADISGTTNAVNLSGRDSKVLLNGSTSPITLRAYPGNPAVMNGTIGESPVAGTKFSKYTVYGDPASSSVTYLQEGVLSEVWVDGVQVSSVNQDDVLGDGTVSFDRDTGVLTLNGAKLTKVYDQGAIRANGPLTVNVTGSSTIELDSSVSSHGIYTNGDLVLTGSKDLGIRIGSDAYDAVNASGSVTVNMDGNLTIESGDDGIYTISYGTRGGVTLAGKGNVTITAGDDAVNADGSFAISGSGNVTMTAGFDCVYAYDGITVSGSGDVTLDAVNHCLYTGDNIVLSGSGNVNLTAVEEAVESFSGVTIGASGNVTITSTNNDGVFVQGGVTITDSAVVTVNGARCGINTKGSLVFSGSGGSADIYGEQLGVKLEGRSSAVLLEGSASPISLRTKAGYKAVVNATTQESPVAGTNFSKYKVTGDPASSSVVYEVRNYDCGGDPSICPGGKFTDMPKYSNWAHKGIEFAVETGLFSGLSETTFGPNEPMNRAMLVTVLWKFAGSPEGYTQSFSDVGSSKWYAKAVAWASTKGIVNGVGNNKFNPNGPVTREQLALILYNYSKMQGCDVSGGVMLAGFADQSKVSGWAFDAMSWAVGEGLLSGTIKNGQPYLQPKASATRAQVATILMAYITQYLTK